jgi:hypothetical protein
VGIGDSACVVEIAWIQDDYLPAFIAEAKDT